MSFRLIAALLSSVVMALAVPAAAAPSQLVIFGDSLVDSGNIFLATGGFAPTNMFNNPSRGYFPGRFTNGPDWTDLLSNQLFGHYTVPSLAGGSNYAFGGATYVANADPVPDLAAQFATYSAGHVVDPNALYIINLGGDDDFAIENGTIPSVLVPAYEAALRAVLGTTLQALDAGGAKNILVTGVPNTTATGYALDAVVQSELDAVQPTLSNATLFRFSYQDFFTRLAADPTAFGVAPFTHAPTDGCFSHLTPPATMDCSGYFSVDGIHPIAPIQAAIYQGVRLSVSAAIPEPATWLTMILGFGLIGGASRQRRFSGTVASV